RNAARPTMPSASRPGGNGGRGPYRLLVLVALYSVGHREPMRRRARMIPQKRTGRRGLWPVLAEKRGDNRRRAGRPASQWATGGRHGTAVTSTRSERIGDHAVGGWAVGAGG